MTMTKEEAGVVLGELVRVQVMALVDDTESTGIVLGQSHDCIVVNVNVGAGDIGKVIGKQGRMARSLRTILGAASMKCGVRCELNICEGAELDSGNGGA
jgi:predicted RNA-binding protein YlqC (UPF0109 family)